MIKEKKAKEVSINEQIVEKRKKLEEIHASMSVHMMVQQPRSKAVKINELQERLEFRVKQYESQLLDEKIGIFSEVLTILRS